MLSINKLSYYISGVPLYHQASLHIGPKDKVGLVGLNGKGKSTLLKIIFGEIQPDEGKISTSGDCTIGFLNQDMLSIQSEESILSITMGAFEEARLIQQKIERILLDLEKNPSDSLINKLSSLQEKFGDLGGYSMQAKAEEILEGIGFRTHQLHQPLNEFSGGWRMRVMLAKLLLEKPSLLLLDEPTNHLDMPSIEWVENYLKTYEGATLIVSHDRRFLNNAIAKIVEVANQTLTMYEGDYDFYVNEKELRSEIQQNAFINQQQHIRQTERFIERFKAKSTKARQVQSRIKALDRLEKIEEVVQNNATVNFQFTFSRRSGRFVSQLANVSKTFGPVKVFEETSVCIERGDKIALIGANGKGKSTLLRIIAGTESVSGDVKKGFNVIQGFYAQHQLDALTLNNEILEELKLAGTGKTEQDLRNVLGCFLFSGDDVFKKIKVLSGGEKSRVALAKTLISEANFLLLDEPTNHLDMQSENILIQALQQYEGSFVVVSHNRHFANQVANKIWYIENNKIKEYPGTFDEYEYWLSQRRSPHPSKLAKQEKKKVKKSSYPQKRVKNKNSTLVTDLQTIETELMKKEEEKGEIERQLSQPKIYSNPDKLVKYSTQLAAINEQLADLTQKWELIIEQLETWDKG